jgi:TalC/MipB family fructose-6-phosphate aldolase
MKEVVIVEFMLDTVNLPLIEKYSKIIKLSGVTSNPSIIKREGKIDFFNHLRKIRKIIGQTAKLHVQVTGRSTADMITDAHRILAEIDNDVYIKVPTNEAGLAAIKQLKNEGIHITATAIYSELQGFLAVAAGADYLAPYYNRMLNMNIDAAYVIRALNHEISQDRSTTKILAASFHNCQQVNEAIESGADAVTIGPDILKTALTNPAINAAIKDFTDDWESIYGKNSIIAEI